MIVGRATQVLPGASLRAHVSPARNQNPPPVELTAASPCPVPTSVIQEAALRPLRIKDPPAAQRKDTGTSFPSLWPACSPDGRGSPRRSKGAKKLTLTPMKKIPSGKGTPDQSQYQRRRRTRRRRPSVIGQQTGAGGARNRVWSDRLDPGEHQRSGVLRRSLASPSKQRARDAPT